MNIATAIGATEETAQPFYQKPLPAITNHAKNVQAVTGASHMQFLIPRDVARQVVPLPATIYILWGNMHYKKAEHYRYNPHWLC